MAGLVAQSATFGRRDQKTGMPGTRPREAGEQGMNGERV
jgi:hypothetical protein